MLQEVVKYVQEGWPGKSPDPILQPYFNREYESSVWGTPGKCLARGQRLDIPNKLQHRIPKMVHKGHIGMTRMKQRGRDSVWWPGLDKQIEEYVRNCDICAMSGKSVKPRAAPLETVEWPEQP